MAFKRFQDVDARLGDPKPLTQEEARDAIPFMRHISAGSLQRYTAEVSLMNVKAVQDFDRSSSRLAMWMMILVAGQIILGLAQVVVALSRH